MDTQIQKLIHDEYFGIYTRNGIEYILENKRSKLKIFLIDYDDIKEMNNQLGYHKVNDILSGVFDKLKSDFIIGRAFSGDEIFFCTDNLKSDINKIKKISSDNNLKFKYVYNIHNPESNNIKESFNQLIDKLHEQQQQT